MYCTSLFNLIHRTPILVAAIGLTGVVNLANNPGPGDRYGTAQTLSVAEHKLVSERSELAVQVVQLRASFDRLNAKPTEDQVRQVLHQTDACTDVNVRDVLDDPDESREVAWVLYLDAYSKGGTKQANQLFSPPRK